MVDKREFDQSAKRKERLVEDSPASDSSPPARVSHLRKPPSAKRDQARAGSPLPDNSGNKSPSQPRVDGKYVLFWRRLIAGIIDSFLIGWILILPCAAFVYFGYAVRHFASTKQAAGLLPHTTGNFSVHDLFASWLVIAFVSISWLVLTWLYVPYSESSHRQGAIGKRLVGLKVTDFDDRQMSVSSATFRFVVQCMLNFVFIALPFIALFAGIIHPNVARICCIWSPVVILLTCGLPLFSDYSQTLLDKLFYRKVVRSTYPAPLFPLPAIEVAFATLTAAAMLGCVIMPYLNIRAHDLEIDRRESRWSRNETGAAFLTRRKILVGEKIAANDIDPVKLPPFRTPVFAIENKSHIENRLASERMEKGTVITRYDALPHSFRLARLVSDKVAPYTDPKIFRIGLSTCNEYIHEHPSRGSGYHGRAWLLMQHGEYSKALQDCNHAIRINKNYPDYYKTRSQVFEALHQSANSISDLTKAISLDDDDRESRMARAEAFIKQRNYRKAQQDVSKLLEAYEDDVDALALRAKIYQHMKKHALAKMDLKRIKEIEGQ